ncbi:MAG: peptidoglycan DD-metalloendopeptidase family protein [Oscillospiraceae bacterium]|nr:peptidoglycan DD-metalloendopeptidase family protein [Oscillospiraceae bacterium]
MVYKSKFHKRRMMRLISLILVCASLLAFAVTSSVAQSGNVDANNKKIADLQKEADEIRKKNQERELEIDSLRGDVAQQEKLMSTVNTQIYEINVQIDAFANLINTKQISIDETRVIVAQKEFEILNAETRINQKKLEIERLDKENNENIGKFGQIAAQMYMNSGNDALGLLSGSTSFYDILVRAEMIRNIGESNVTFMEELLEAIKRQETEIIGLEKDILHLEGEKIIFEKQQKELETEMLELEAEKSVVSEEVNRQYNTLLSLTAERDELQKSVTGLKSQVEENTKEFNGIMRDIAELEAQNRAIEQAVRNAQNANPDREVFSSSGFIWPVERRFPITGGFGWDPWRNGVHTGVDFGSHGIGGTGIFAVQSGTVITATDGGNWNGGYGNYVIVDHGGGISTLYAHMRNGISVSVGQFVTQGQTLGLVGTTGWSTGDHLHFEVRVNGTAVNPAGYIQ